MSANREVMTSDFIENRADDIDDARKDSFYGGAGQRDAKSCNSAI